jgi:hypothetical protein
MFAAIVSGPEKLEENWLRLPAAKVVESIIRLLPPSLVMVSVLIVVLESPTTVGSNE